MSLAEALAPMAAGAGLWRLAAPRGRVSALGPILAALGREGVRVSPLRVIEAGARLEGIAAELEDRDAAGVLVAALPGWDACGQVAVIVEAARFADVPTVFLEFVPPDALTVEIGG